MARQSGPQAALGPAELEAELRAAGMPERAAGSRRYLKSDRTHLGAAVPQVRSIVRGYARGRPDLDDNDLDDLVRTLWASEIYDCCLSAVLLLAAYPRLVTAGDLPLLRDLASDARTWALLDPLATEVLGELVLREPAAAEQIDGWIADESFWVRRAALLSQLRPATRHGELDRFFTYAEALLDEREFFIAKAIGWVLREVAKRQPDAVFAWLAPRIDRACAVTVREAVKPLTPRRREELRAARAEARATDRPEPGQPTGPRSAEGAQMGAFGPNTVAGRSRPR